MTTAKIWDGTQWVKVIGAQGDPGPKGDPGPQGASGLALGDDVALNQGELVQGGALEPEAIPIPEYGQTLRRKGVQLAWGISRDVFLNDRSDIDPTGVSNMGNIITTYLDEYTLLPYSSNVYMERGSTYLIGSGETVRMPSGIKLFGPSSRGGSSGGQAILKAGANDVRLLTMGVYPSQHRHHQRVDGLVFDLGNSSGRTGTVGIWMEATLYPVIENNRFLNGAAGTAAVRGGSVLYLIFRDNYMQSLLGRGVDLLEDHSTTNTYYGVNVGIIENNIFSGQENAIRFDGSVRIIGNDFEAGSGDVGAAVQIGGFGTATKGVVHENYFEGGKYAIRIGADATVSIENNEMYGNQASGSIAIGLSSTYIGKAKINFNYMTSFETGIDLGLSSVGSGKKGWTVLANSFGPNVTTPVTNGGLSTKKTGVEDSVALVQTDKTTRYRGRFSGGAVTWVDVDGSILDLNQGNHFYLNFAAPVTLTYTGNVNAYGHHFTMTFANGNVTLQNSQWRLLGGADETIASGSVRNFVCDPNNGTVREVGQKLPKQAALTAADNTIIDATYGTTEQTVIENLRTRVNELETKLQALKLLT